MLNEDEIFKKLSHNMTLEELEYLTYNDYTWYVLRTCPAAIQLKTAIRMLNFLRYGY